MSRRSISIAKSSHNPSANKFRQTRSQFAIEPELLNTLTNNWYIKKSKQINLIIPKSLHTHQRTQPFKLVIYKITGLNPTKSSSNLQYYLKISAQFITKNLDLLSDSQIYQCIQPIQQGKYEYPICLYYHSSIDRNEDNFKMLISFQLLGINNNGVVQSVNCVGNTVIDKPLIQQSKKSISIYKQYPATEILNGLQKLAASSSTMNYEIQSRFELKNLTKIVPANQIFSCQNQITGILDSFLLNEPDQNVYEQQICHINIKSLQIHIPQKYQTSLLEQIRKLRLVQGDLKINKRKVLCGFHNQFQFVGAAQRKLDFIQKQATGQWNINIYEAVSDQEILKLPYYVIPKQSQNNCTLGICLLYQVSGIQFEIETAIFCISPNFSGQQIDLSEKMITGAGIGLRGQVIDCKCDRVPTILFQYKSQEVVNEDDVQINSGNILKTSQRIPVKASKRIITQQQIKMQSRMMQEIQRERLMLERQRQQLQRLKTNQNISYHDDFERRLQIERQQLWKRQRAIEEQYRQQVQNEIRRKIELQNEIRQMKERLLAVEQGSGLVTRKQSYDQTPRIQENDYVRYPNNDSIATGMFNFSMQKVNPGYLMQQQKTIPIAQVRQTLMSNFQKNKDLIQKQYSMFNYASKFTFDLTTIIWSHQLQPPKSFYVLIRFFNFSEFRTDTISYIQSESEHHQLIKLAHYTYGYQDIAPTYSFTIDPSEFSNPQLIQQDLTNYLCKNNAIMDIFDAETHIYIGQINIKLSDLLRGNKSQTLVAKQFNIVRIKNQQNYGVIQILMKNEQIECKNPVSVVHKKRERDVKKKVISNAPLLLMKDQTKDMKNSKQINLVQNQTTKNRQQERILNYKKKIQSAKNSGLVKFDGLSDQEKGHMINKIQEYKEKKMPQYINKVYQRILNDHITINPHLGQSKTFHYQFTNISDSPGSFRISISAGDQNQIDDLKIIKNTGQWKYYVSKYGFPAPKLFQCINDQNCFYLTGGDSLPLLFKYLSFNDHVSENKTQRKFINVSIIKQENNWIVGGFSLIVQPHESIINHSYILYQPGDHLMDLILPVLYSSSDARIPKHLYVTSNSVSAQWVNQYQIMLRMQTPQIMNKMKFNLFLYQDQYFEVLKQNWLVETHSYQGVCTFSRPQQKTKFKICLPANIPLPQSSRKLRLNSSHPDLIFQEQIIQGIKLQRAGPIEIWCELLPNSSATELQITCTDPYFKLVYGWIVQIFPYVPKRS